jgi:hypothetical protein
LRSRWSFRREDGEIRAYDFAVVAIDAGFRLLHHGRAIALDIVPRGELEHIPGAVGDAVTAPFASLIHNVHNSLRNQNLFRIEGSSPKLHVTHVPFILGAKFISAYRQSEWCILSEVESMSRNIVEFRNQIPRYRITLEGGIESGHSVCLLRRFREESEERN